MPASLSDLAIQRFLSQKDVAVLSTLQQDGSPLAMPMWFLADPECLYMLSLAQTQKVRNLRRDPRLCVVVESGTRGAEVRGVSIQGRAEFVERAEDIQPVVARMVRKYDPHLATLWAGTTMPSNRVLWRIISMHVYSWGL